MKIHEPAMTFKGDQAAADWQEWVTNNQDPYGNACCRYASEWATRMEQQIAADGVEVSSETAIDKWLKANAGKISHDADDEGITGFMYGCAVQMVAHCWAHGERLRRWHNLDTQLGDEGEKANESGGVLNPAILNIG